jgi:F-type H+-transporting ATPase subunit b
MIKEASKIQEQMLEDAREKASLESEKMIGVARKKIQSEKEIALQDLREEVAKLSLDLTEKILREELSTDKAQMKMIDRLLDEIEITSS